MNKSNAKNILLGTILSGGLLFGAAGCSKNKEPKDAEKPNTEIENTQDKYGNIALLEASRNDIKFALAFAENYYQYIYWCGEAWTAGHGLTVFYDANGVQRYVTQNTPVPTIAESDMYQDNYLTFALAPVIRKYVKVPMDENTLLAACILGYCIGPDNLATSSFIKAVNAGKTGTELAKTLTGWRQQQGVPNRCYFFAAMVAGKMQYGDLLTLRANGCYNLEWQDIFVYQNGHPKCDANGFYEWDFSKLKINLAKARRPRTETITIGRGKKPKTVKINCQMTKDIVTESVWQNVSTASQDRIDAINNINNTATDANAMNDTSYIAYQNGDYDKALKYAQTALELSETSKQFGASYYNIGMAQMAKGQYGRAKDSFTNSLAYNKTNAAQKQLDIAQQKHTEKRKKTTRNIALFALGAGALGYGGKKYIMQRQGSRHR